MGAEDNRLTLQGLAQRLEVLERENAELRHKVATLDGSGTRREEEPLFESDRQLSRRRLLSKAGAAAVGLVVAGALTQRDIREAKADQIVATVDQPSAGAVVGANTNNNGYGVFGKGGRGVYGVGERGIAIGVYGEGANGVEGASTTLDGAGVKGTGPVGVLGSANKIGRGAVEGSNPNAGGYGVWGESTSGIGVRGTSSAASLGAIEGHNDGGGTGVAGVGRVGMLGFSHTDGWPAIWGRHTGNWAGISGDSAKGVGVYGEASSEGLQGVFGRAKGTSEGVAGESLNGTGVLGNGKTGVVGGSTGGGYGGQFQGGKAQLRLVPKPAGTTGPPTGSHAKGEIYMDGAGTLFVCTAGGNPATWKRIQTTAV